MRRPSVAVKAVSEAVKKTPASIKVTADNDANEDLTVSPSHGPRARAVTAQWGVLWGDLLLLPLPIDPANRPRSPPRSSTCLVLELLVSRPSSSRCFTS